MNVYVVHSVGKNAGGRDAKASLSVAVFREDVIAPLWGAMSGGWGVPSLRR